jgi:hypothetical protein
LDQVDEQRVDRLSLGLYYVFCKDTEQDPDMSFGITKTIPAGAGIVTLDSLYDGSCREYEFHMAGSEPKRLKPGDYVYTIFNDQLHGRLKIREFITGASNPNSGRPRILIIVDAPGERLKNPLPRKGHRGTRYTEGEDWPA